MKDKILTSSFLTLNAIILKYYACSKASLKPGKCIWGRRSYIMIHCHPLDVCGRFHRTHQRLPSTPSQCSATKSDHLLLKLPISSKQLQILEFLGVPRSAMLDHFRNRARKVSLKMVSSHSPYLFISLAKTRFTTICKTTGVLD